MLEAPRRPVCVLIVLGLLSACALPVRQEALQQPIVLSSGRSFVLTADATCSINTGYSRTLRQGTHWQLDGTIPQGDVYRSPDQTLTVEGFNVHEAFPVVQNDALVGFYLPVEKTFTPTSKPVPLMLNRNQGENE